MQSKPAAETATGAGIAAEARIEAFEYPASGADCDAPVWNGYCDLEGKSDPGAGSVTHHAGHPDWEIRLAEETRKAFEAGREEAQREAGNAERGALADARRQEERRMAGLMESFAEARERYLRTVEAEVVKLALAVAARIMRREAQMDPLLLTGAVRVALGQLSATTEVKLRVPASDLELWREAIAHVPNLALKPEVLAGEGLRLGECMIESSLGAVDLGIRSQLGEIERGFFDKTGSQAKTESTLETRVLRESRG